MHELHTLEAVRAVLREGEGLGGFVIQGVDLRSLDDALPLADLRNTVFLGCTLSTTAQAALVTRGALVFPALEVPYEPCRPFLYTPDELFRGFDAARPCSYCDTPDAVIYRHWRATGAEKSPSILEDLARRLHDHAITDGIRDFLEPRAPRTVAMMGGHGLRRDAEAYTAVARISRRLTAEGYLMISGGGPGAMEATHLGAWFVDRTAEELDEAIAHLAQAPHYTDLRWLAAAFEVIERWPAPGARHESLGIPTWLYGHEPPNPFATHIAKYFGNAVREEGLVTLARHGILFAPGSAGTIQEIFQDACQNHYAVGGEVCPMVFLDSHFWMHEKPVVPLLRHLAEGRPYADQITVCDTVEEAVDAIRSSGPRAVTSGGWSFCAAHCAS